MGITEIVIIIAGVIVMALGYIMPAKKKDTSEELQLVSEDEARKLIDREMEDVKENITDIVNETIAYSMEKAERAMERVTNEKIMAINEYSDTVLEEINKNHKEVLFLYDMLNDKDDNLKNVVTEALKTAEEIKQTVRDAEITARETKEAVINAGTVPKEPKEPAKIAEPPVSEKESFVPFIPPRVEIIHEPDGDYIAPEPIDDFLNFETAVDQLVEAVPLEEEAEDYRMFHEDEVQSLDTESANGKNNVRNSNDRILELHKAGKSNMAIAKELGLGIGEVKLVIDLFEGF